MKNIINNIEIFLFEKKNILLVFLFYLTNLIITLFCSFFIDFFEEPYTRNEHFYSSKIQLIISVLFIAPFLETFLFQYLIFIIFRKYKINNLFFLCVSSILFTSIHLYKYENLLEIINIFLIGINLAYAYLLFTKKEGSSAFKNVYLIHLLYNSTILVIYLIYL